MAGVYEKTVDRESAYEMLKARAEQATRRGRGSQASSRPRLRRRPRDGGAWAAYWGIFWVGAAAAARAPSRPWRVAARAIGSQVGRAIIRGVLGSLLGGKR